jgi:hypothetical protein
MFKYFPTTSKVHQSFQHTYLRINQPFGGQRQRRQPPYPRVRPSSDFVKLWSLRLCRRPLPTYSHVGVGSRFLGSVFCFFSILIFFQFVIRISTHVTCNLAPKSIQNPSNIDPKSILKSSPNSLSNSLFFLRFSIAPSIKNQANKLYSCSKSHFRNFRF